MIDAKKMMHLKSLLCFLKLGMLGEHNRQYEMDIMSANYLATHPLAVTDAIDALTEALAELRVEVTPR